MTVAGWSCALWEPPVRDADPKVRRAARDLENDIFKKTLCFVFFFDAEPLLKACRGNDRSPDLQKPQQLLQNHRGMTVEDDGALCENLRFFKRDPQVRQAARDLENDNFFFLFFDAEHSLKASCWNDRNLCKNLRTCSQLTFEWRCCPPLPNRRFLKQVRRGAARDRCPYSLAVFSRRANLFPDNGWRKVPLVDEIWCHEVISNAKT